MADEFDLTVLQLAERVARAVLTQLEDHQHMAIFDAPLDLCAQAVLATLHETGHCFCRIKRAS